MATTRVVATYQTPDGVPQKGFVTFNLVVDAFQDTLDAVITSSPVKVPMDIEGNIAVNLEPTSGDDADFAMTGLTYRVTESFETAGGKVRDRRKYFVDVPTAVGDVNLGELATYAAAPGVTVNDALAAQVAANTGAIEAHEEETLFDGVHGLPNDPEVGQVLSYTDDTPPTLAWADQTGEGVSSHTDLTNRSDADSHPMSAITGLVSALAGKASTIHSHAHDDITGRDATDSHPQAAITGLVSALAGKASSSHTHAQSDITNLVSDLAGKASSAHTHTGIYDPSGTASAAVSAHVAASDPHPTYLTSAEGTAAYAPLAQAVPTSGAASGKVLGYASSTPTWIDPPAPIAPVVIPGVATGSIPLRVNGFDGATVNLFDVRRNVAGAYTVVLSADETGSVKAGPGTATSDAALKVGQSDPAKKGMTVRLAASATADGFQQLDSGGTPTVKFGPDGFITALNIGPMLAILAADDDLPDIAFDYVVLREPA